MRPNTLTVLTFIVATVVFVGTLLWAAQFAAALDYTVVSYVLYVIAVLQYISIAIESDKDIRSHRYL